MIDIDGHLNLEKIEELVMLLNITIRIYQTYAGYHIFITSEEILYTSSYSKYVMNLFHADPYYAVFTSKYGYRIRLNCKIREKNDEISAAKYLTTYGKAAELPLLLRYLKIHDTYIKKHKANKIF